MKRKTSKPKLNRRGPQIGQRRVLCIQGCETAVLPTSLICRKCRRANRIKVARKTKQHEQS